MATYNSVSPIKCHRNPAIRRGIGVRVGEPFKDYKGRPLVDTHLDTPIIDSMGFGRPVTIEEWPAKVIEDTRLILERLDVAIAELQGHRDRLAAELAQLEAGNVMLPGLE